MSVKAHTDTRRRRRGFNVGGVRVLNNPPAMRHIGHFATPPSRARTLVPRLFAHVYRCIRIRIRTHSPHPAPWPGLAWTLVPCLRVYSVPVYHTVAWGVPVTVSKQCGSSPPVSRTLVKGQADNARHVIIHISDPRFLSEILNDITRQADIARHVNMHSRPPLLLELHVKGHHQTWRAISARPYPRGAGLFAVGLGAHQVPVRYGCQHNLNVSVRCTEIFVSYRPRNVSHQERKVNDEGMKA